RSARPSRSAACFSPRASRASNSGEKSNDIAFLLCWIQLRFEFRHFVEPQPLLVSAGLQFGVPRAPDSDARRGDAQSAGGVRCGELVGASDVATFDGLEVLVAGVAALAPALASPVVEEALPLVVLALDAPSAVQAWGGLLGPLALVQHVL